jgi:hypothetical protein
MSIQLTDGGAVSPGAQAFSPNGEAIAPGLP